jgi:hypothetical protein
MRISEYGIVIVLLTASTVKPGENSTLNSFFRALPDRCATIFGRATLSRRAQTSLFKAMHRILVQKVTASFGGRIAK